MILCFQVLFRMAAKDGFSLHTIASSHDIRQGFVARGFKKIPTDRHAVRRYIQSFRASVQHDLKETIQSKLSDGEKVSVTFDEWTSVRNRKYMCVNLHGKSGELQPLGLSKIYGSAPASVLAEKLVRRPNDYRVNMAKDVVALICDGASANWAVARQLQKEDWTQFCVAHGVHLAVCDQLYRSPIAVVNCDEQECDSDDDNQEDDGYTELSENISASVAKLREIVKLFRESALNTDKVLAVLQADRISESTFQIDSKTGCHEILKMTLSWIT